jgi:hypothetical protein
MNSSPNFSARLRYTILTAIDTQKPRNSSISNEHDCIGFPEFTVAAHDECINEEATRQQGSLFFKGE